MTWPEDGKVFLAANPWPLAAEAKRQGYDTDRFLPIGVLFEERDGTGTLRVFEDAEARDPHLSKMRREFESFEKAVSSWNRSALISTYTRIGACDVTI